MVQENWILNRFPTKKVFQVQMVCREEQQQPPRVVVLIGPFVSVGTLVHQLHRLTAWTALALFVNRVMLSVMILLPCFVPCLLCDPFYACAVLLPFGCDWCCERLHRRARVMLHKCEMLRQEQILRPEQRVVLK